MRVPSLMPSTLSGKGPRSMLHLVVVVEDNRDWEWACTRPQDLEGSPCSEGDDY